MAPGHAFRVDFLGLGRVAELCAIQRLEYSFDLPEMAALVRRKHAKCAVNVIAKTSIHRGFYPHLINRKANGGLYGLRKLSLRLFKRCPCGIEVVLTRNKGRKDFKPQQVWRLQIPEEQPRESASPQCPVCGEAWSARDGS